MKYPVSIFDIQKDLKVWGFWFVVYQHGFTPRTLWLIFVAKRMTPAF
jgi:hypothetical protein